MLPGDSEDFEQFVKDGAEFFLSRDSAKFQLKWLTYLLPI
jgi:hypothetical protein